MGVLMQLLKNGAIDAIVSAGNTGALFGFSIVLLGKIEGISRPGLAITLPVETGYSVMLDVGSNLNPKAIDYCNYGLMGTVLAKLISDKKNPRVALLNVGSEQMKGDETRKRAYQMLNDSACNFIGNIEGNDIMKGFADTIVCDGFTGNVIIKFSEGMIDNLWLMLQEEVDAVARQRFGQYLVKPAIKELRAKFNYEEYGGGILLGVNGIVIICHGRSSPQALKNAVRFSKTCIDYKIVSMIKERSI
jgi:glycerol-3-phosphate acyltransferase PlsX